MSDELDAALRRLWLPAQYSKGETLVFASDIYLMLTDRERLLDEADAANRVVRDDCTRNKCVRDILNHAVSNASPQKAMEYVRDAITLLETP